MSRAYKFNNPAGLYFVSFATVGWIDVFTRETYPYWYLKILNFLTKVIQTKHLS